MQVAVQELNRVARKHRLDFIALFGSMARNGTGRDIDLAAGAEPSLLIWSDSCEETDEWIGTSFNASSCR